MSEEALITDLKEQIRVLKRKLMTAEKLRYESATQQGDSPIWDARLLASGVAHEFNNILGAADGHAEWALESDDVDDMKEALEIVRQACARSMKITRSLQGFGGPTEDEVTVFSLEDVLSALARDFAPLISKQNIRYEVRCDPVELYGNESRFYEVLLNLLKNGAEVLEAYHEQEHPMVSVVGTVQDDKYYSIVVSDNGPGVPPPLKERIFEPFFTTKGTLSHVAEGQKVSHGSASAGSGLGLYVSRSIIDEMGGRIKLLEPQEGCSFQMVLPIAPKE